MASFPVYLLRFKGQWQVIFPDNGEDIGHSEFWKQTVTFLVAKHYGIPQKMLENLPYCQRRARIVEPDRLYYGGKHDPDLLRAVQKAVENPNLRFVYDDHERRLREDVSQLRQLIERYRPKHRK